MPRRPWNLFLSVLVFFLVLSAGALSKEPLTLEALTQLSARALSRPGNPVWSPDGSKFVYAQSGALHLYEKASLSSRKLLDLKDVDKDAAAVPEPEAFGFENRRVRAESIQWFPDNQRLLLVRRGDLFLLDSSTGKSEQITKTAFSEEDPKLSPNGRFIAYRHDNELWSLEVDTRKIRQLTKDSTPTRWNARLDWVYPEELDLGTAYWWSPDSARIAYLQFEVSRQFVYTHADLNKVLSVPEPQRYPHAGTPNANVRLGSLDLKSAKTKWLLDIPGDTHLLWRVHWAPDSRLLAVQRSNRVQDQLDLLFIDSLSAQQGVALSETSKSWINSSDDFRFLPGNRFLWSTESSGWRHLETYSYQGLTATRQAAITSGEWAVTGVAGVDEKSGWIYFSSTEPSPLERHLYRIRLDGSSKQRLSEGEGLFSISLSPDSAWYLETSQGPSTPPRAVLRRGDGSELKPYWHSDVSAYDKYELPTTEIVSFQDQEGHTFYGRITRPPFFDPTRTYPVIVSVYGGPHAQTVTRSWSSPSWLHVLASRGFVIWEMDNRGSANRGLAWESALYREMGRIELEDQLKGLDFLATQVLTDPRRIGVTGWSYGGYMTLNALLNAPQRFAAGAAGAPVTDWRFYDTIYTERYLGLPQKNETGYQKSSLAQHAKQLAGDLLLIHCYEDDNVLFQNSLRMITELENAGKQFQFALYPDKAHGVGMQRQRHLRQQMIDFFVAALKP
jgi:dipeptidyl-peptidase-4